MKKFLIKKVINKYLRKKKFPGSKQYWEQRYKEGGNSGDGSYNRKAKFKADILNDFIVENNINSVIEFGCGDGNQLLYAKYPEYIGLDVSVTAISMCIKKFTDDTTKSFYLYDQFAFKDNHNLFRSELTISLDVIYHLVEDAVFDKYMQHLFDSAVKYVIIFASDNDSAVRYHVRWRQFTKWIKTNRPDWKMIKKTENEEFENDFYFFEKMN